MKSVRSRAMNVAVLIEAAAMLMFFRVVLVAVPFRRLISWVERPDVSEHRVSEAAIIRRVRGAVLAVVKRSPIVLACFPQSLACYFMLRRRGISTTLFFGVARTGANLEAHTWLKRGDQFVIGGELSPQFTVLARFGSMEPSTPNAMMLRTPE